METIVYDPTQTEPEKFNPELAKVAAEVVLGRKGKLAKALAKAQSKFTTVKKSKTAKVKGKTADGRQYEYEYKYADLADILGMALPCLANEGVAFSQPLRRKDGKLYVITRLEFEDEIKEDDGLVIPEQVKPAELGSYLSYYRRYGVSTFLGISSEEDTDAPEESVKVESKSSASVQEPPKKGRPATKTETKKEEAQQVNPAAQSSSTFQATEDDVPNNISPLPDAGQRKDYIARLKELISKSDKDKVQHFIAGIVGGEFTTSTLTIAQWNEALGKMESADKEGKLKEVLGV